MHFNNYFVVKICHTCDKDERQGSYVIVPSVRGHVAPRVMTRRRDARLISE